MPPACTQHANKSIFTVHKISLHKALKSLPRLQNAFKSLPCTQKLAMPAECIQELCEDQGLLHHRQACHPDVSERHQGQH